MPSNRLGHESGVSERAALKHTSDLEDAQDLGAGDGGDLGHAHGVTQADTDLRWGQTLLGELDDLLLDGVRLDAAPRRRGAAVREGGAGNALADQTKARGTLSGRWRGKFASKRVCAYPLLCMRPMVAGGFGRTENDSSCRNVLAPICG